VPRRRAHASTADEVAGFLTGPAVEGAFAGTHADAFQFRPRAAIVNPFDVVHDDVRAQFRAAMTAFPGGVPAHLRGRQLIVQGALDRGLNVFEQMALIVFDRQDVVARRRRSDWQSPSGNHGVDVTSALQVESNAKSLGIAVISFESPSTAT
jgi:hypothetical protein